MNWNRVLNILILIFLAINIILWASYEYKGKEEYTLSFEKVQQLQEISGHYGIDIYANLPEFYPKYIMLVEPNKVNEDKIKQSFFGKNKVTYLPQPGETTYKYNGEELVIYKGNNYGMITYKSVDEKYKPKVFAKDEVEKLGIEFVEKLIPKNTSFKLTSSILNDQNNEYMLQFNEVYKGETLFDNTITIKVTKTGIKEAKLLRYFRPTKFIGNKHELYPVDEVLYKLMNNIDVKGKNEFIKGIDIGYKVELDEFIDSDIIEAVPYYKIQFSSGEEYYINAYKTR